MIVRDEAGQLLRCLDSVRGVADELCVLDTGSTDASAELARAQGAKVACFAWCDDFAAARNAVLSMAHGDWVLVLDADEELVTPPRAARAVLEAFARSRAGSAGRLLVENLDQAIVKSRSRITRFFPNDGAHRFRGRIHEQLVRLEAGQPREPRRADLELVVRHHGYAESVVRERGKLERNARLLERALDDDPTDGYLWYQLGRTRALAGDSAGALPALESALERCPDGAGWGIQALEEGAYSLRALGASARALSLLEEVEADWIDRADTVFLIGLLALDLGDLERAEHGFRRCLELAGEGSVRAEESAAATTFAPAYNLGMMCELSERFEEARGHYLRALSFHPAHAPSKEGLERLARRAGGECALPSRPSVR